MRIFVTETMTKQTIALAVQPYGTVQDLMEMIEMTVGMPPYLQGWVFIGQQLEDGHKLSYYNIHEESTLHQTLFIYRSGYWCRYETPVWPYIYE